MTTDKIRNILILPPMLESTLWWKYVAWVARKINENNWCFQNFHMVTYECSEYIKKTMPALFVNGNPRILSFPSLMARLPIRSRLHFLYSEKLSHTIAITLINVIRKHPILWSNLLLVYCWLVWKIWQIKFCFFVVCNCFSTFGFCWSLLYKM